MRNFRVVPALLLGLALVAHGGYSRSLVKTRIDADGDGCDTREEVLEAEAVQAPTQGSGCTLSGGRCYSWYDEAYWTDKSEVDIDHGMPVTVSRPAKSGVVQLVVVVVDV